MRCGSGRGGDACAITVACVGALTDGTVTIVLPVVRALDAPPGDDAQLPSTPVTEAAVRPLLVLICTDAIVVPLPLGYVDTRIEPPGTPSAAPSCEMSVASP